MSKLSRRGFLAGAAAGLGALEIAATPFTAAAPEQQPQSGGGPRLGLVTYLLASEWDVPTIIANCTEAGFEAVELRTTHAHGVEVTLSPAERATVRRTFEDSPVRLASLGSAFEYHSPDPQELRKNIEGTRQYLKLAADLGCDGIKVRPNRLCEDQGIKPEVTIAQIARSLDEVGAAGAELGVEIRVEVHGRDTSRIPVYHRIMESCTSPNVFVCWNCNQLDLEDGGLEKNFSLLADKIHFVHMRDLFLEEYPWRRFLTLLNGIGYTGYCCAEIPASTDPLRVMRYYRALFLAFQDRI
ncbi:MAG: sugar phosphate isomerase/epimerase [Candidatus Glassbacteria bacterium]|nr:sugar phosphate isomerase/epimerase [Candidatus Glassbacteria bacterium]